MSDRSRSTSGGCAGLIILAVVGLIWAIPSFITAQLNNSTQVITVTRLDDQSLGKSGHQYLVFTDKGVFKDTDNLWLGKTNSSDLYNQLQVGSTYRCAVHGVRQHLTSNYPDLLSCVKVPRG